MVLEIQIMNKRLEQKPITLIFLGTSTSGKLTLLIKDLFNAISNIHKVLIFHQQFTYK